jgi:hypothetical protein
MASERIIPGGWIRSPEVLGRAKTALFTELPEYRFRLPVVRAGSFFQILTVLPLVGPNASTLPDA